jgi:CubicO group peptidase (beta-lactamase class C family)
MTDKSDPGTDPIGRALERHVAVRDLAGAATLVWRDGQLIQQACAGVRDLTTRDPVARDTIFRIASLTKPITAVAALRMLEDGRFGLDTPVTDVAAELARMRVLRDVDGSLDDTVDAVRPITFGDLLTHWSGLTYGDFHRGPVGRAYADALGN